MSSPRQYDIVVFGATGYTGKLTAEYITSRLPTDLRWALAGRSQSKLEGIAAECKTLNADRVPPAIEVCGLNDEDLDSLAKKTRLLISGVGPFCLYGEFAFKACANNGTHYLDVTGEAPFVADMIKKYEVTAKASGSIMIAQIGIESALADVAAWTLVDMIRTRFSSPTADVVLAIEDMNISVTGSTMVTPFALIEAYSIKDILAANAPYALSPVPGPKVRDNTSLFTKLFGVRSVPDLGTLTTCMSGSVDTPIVQRSWGLLGYGPNFRFGEYMKVRNSFQGIAMHLGLAVLPLLLILPFASIFAKIFLPPPGAGPTKELGSKDRLKFRGLGMPDVAAPNPPRALINGVIEGSVYAFTGAIVAEAEMTILQGDHKLSGGIHTPASLGQPFIDRLEPAGLKMEKRFIEY